MKSMPPSVIPLPEGALETVQVIDIFYDLISSVISRESRWNTDGTDEAVNLYHALNYAGEVNNGGHEQYFQNNANQTPIYKSASNGLTMISAHRHARLIETMIVWAEEHPEEVAATLESPIPPTLERLDDLYFEISKNCSVRKLAHEWLRRSPKVRVIPEEDFYKLLFHYQAEARARYDACVQTSASAKSERRGLWNRVIDAIKKRGV
ncbi:DUF4375 domain-containing protein (plasmid) [Rhizobium sp. NIBRBAC000502774]|nr:DUF4375 domain-containing protein [Rhizobium sp. NIBRBAC000502774]